jgi:hypothetical protein
VITGRTTIGFVACAFVVSSVVVDGRAVVVVVDVDVDVVVIAVDGLAAPDSSGL